MSKIIVNAPIQNREFSPDTMVGKVIPIFVADWIRSHDTEYDSSVCHDLWNNVISDEPSQGSYDVKMSERLQSKYGSAVMQARTMQPTEILIDSDQEGFGVWVGGVIERSLELGDTTIEIQAVNVCEGCDSIRNLASDACTYACTACGSNDSIVIDRSVLTSEIDQASLSLSAQATGSRLDERIPSSKTLLSKRRMGGISLAPLGINGLQLDPKVGIVLLAHYAACLANADSVDIVASRATASHNLARAFSLIKNQTSQLPELTMKPIAKAPVEQLKHLEREHIINQQAIIYILTEVLPPHLLSMKRDMSPATLDRIIFSRKR